MANTVDVELLISEVKKRHAIWDTSSEDYKNKDKRLSAWTEVCSCLAEDFVIKPESEQKLILQHLSSKWRAMRDNHVRYLRKKAECDNSGSKNIKPYIYLEQLSFLKRNSELLISEVSLDDGTYKLGWSQADKDEIKIEVENDNEYHESAIPTSSQPVSTTKRKRPDVDHSLVEYADVHKAVTNSVIEDDDLAFFYSLFPIVKSLNMDQKIAFRVQSMQILQNLRNQQ